MSGGSSHVDAKGSSSVSSFCFVWIVFSCVCRLFFDIMPFAGLKEIITEVATGYLLSIFNRGFDSLPFKNISTVTLPQLQGKHDQSIKENIFLWSLFSVSKGGLSYEI